MSKLYPDRLNRDFDCTESNEKIIAAYDQVINEAMKKRFKGKKRGKGGIKLPWNKLKQRLKMMKTKLKKTKAKKTKDAFDMALFKKKGRNIQAKMKKTLKRIIKEQEDYEDYDERVLALAQFLDIEPSEVKELSYGGYEAEGGEYEVLSDDEADERAKDYILDSVWAFNKWFLESYISVEGANEYFGHEESYYDEEEEEEIEIGDAEEVFYMNMGMSFSDWLDEQQRGAESSNDVLVNLLDDESRFVDDAISADGRGHFLGVYDGEENEEDVDGDTYFIYRTN